MKEIRRTAANKKQMVMAYIAYMMGGSLFHRCRCASSQMETRLLLSYREMKEEKVLAAEERVLRELDKKGQRFLGSLADLDCLVHICQEEDQIVLVFETGGFDGLLAEVSEWGGVRFTPLYECERAA
ncbi:MAG: hypothetical protein LIO86_02360 [Lachnospiraceae bacterium]|nr:hypothetical protein [Lachnospiraceae bacterium]